jgi:DNA-binding transcriptional MerR regulator
MNNLDNILPASKEGLYPIRTVSEVTGVNAITLRAWERRYGLFKPKRTPKGHRLYSERDIILIRQVLQLLDKGVAIGRVVNALKNEAKIANFPELKSTKKKASNGLDVSDDQWKTYHHQLLDKISSYDYIQLERLHHEIFSLYPIEIVARSLIRPVLSELQIRASQLQSLSGDYNFYQNFLLQRIGGLFLKSSIQNRGRKILIMGATGEPNEIELLLFTMPLLTHGYQVILLGCDVPFDAVPLTLSKSNSECLVFFVDARETLEKKTIDAFKTVVSCIQAPVFIAGQYMPKQATELAETGLIILPENSVEQTVLIEQSLAANPD